MSVATYFNKRHDDVLKAVRNLLPQIPKHRLRDFAETVILRANPSGGSKIKSPAFHLTRDGFTLLAMGFTGKKAMQFKIAYIEAFNRMEAELAGRESGGKNITVSQSHSRSIQAPGGIGIRYTLDLTPIVRRPTRQSLEVLERLTGISLNDIEAFGGKPVRVAEPSDFFAERCAVVTGGKVLFAQVYSAYKQWVAEKSGPGVSSESAIMFSRELTRAGFVREKLGGTVFVLGLCLQEQEVAL